MGREHSQSEGYLLSSLLSVTCDLLFNPLPDRNNTTQWEYGSKDSGDLTICSNIIHLHVDFIREPVHFFMYVCN